MADIFLHDDELNRVEGSVSDQLRLLDRLPRGTAGREQALKSIAEDLRRLQRLGQQLRVEIRLLDTSTEAEVEAKRQHEKTAQQHSQRLAALKAEYDTKRTATTTTSAASPPRPPTEPTATLRNGSTALHTSAAASPSPPSPPGADSAAAYFAATAGAGNSLPSPPASDTASAPSEKRSRGDGFPSPSSVWSPREDAAVDKQGARSAALRIQDVQHGTLQSLSRTERLLNETETIGAEAATTLRTQTEQIKQTNVQLEEMNSEIGRAGQELKAFMRRMARDRIVITMAIAIVVCVIVIVVLAVLKNKL